MYFIAKGSDFKSQEANCFFSKLADIGNSTPTDLKKKRERNSWLRPYHRAPVIYGRMGRKVMQIYTLQCMYVPSDVSLPLSAVKHGAFV